ncbi:MAG: archaea-specific SMC-related protein [Haloferacaceae archaeon]
MTSQSVTPKSIRVHAENIGGIDETTVELDGGVNVLTGRNATNRTSFLQAIMAAMGSDQVSLKGDADRGRVDLDIDDRTYTRTLSRTGDTVTTDGDPYLEDPTVADLFAFLLETNEARQAVARGDDLRELIMRPIDTDEIQAEIQRLESEKRDLDQQLEELDDLERELPDLERRRSDLNEQIEAKRAELEAKEEELEEADTTVSESREEQAELEDTLDELKSTRSDLETVRFQLETERESLEALEDEREELEAQLEELPASAEAAVADLDGEMETLRERRRELDATLNELQTIIQFNEEMLEGTSTEIADALRDGQGGALTDQLVDSDTVVCWTCGSEVQTDQIEGTLDALRDLRSQKAGEREDVSDRLDELTEERSTLQEREREREQTERRLEQVDQETDQRRESIADLEDRREELLEHVEELEATVDDLESDVQSDVLERHREANQLEFELGRLESDLEDVESEIEQVEQRLDEREELRQRREDVQDELVEQRTRIERTEEGAIEQFSDHMAEVLDLLEYANLERIWIERTERQVREGRRKVTRSTFDLHIVRSTESGATYEDTIDHLSESEREVTGLVFALAGYLVHDVHEIVPLVLLDSLEAIDSGRIAALVDYLAEYADYLVVALLPEDAAALDDDYQRVTDI